MLRKLYMLFGNLVHRNGALTFWKEGIADVFEIGEYSGGYNRRITISQSNRIIRLPATEGE